MTPLHATASRSRPVRRRPAFAALTALTAATLLGLLAVAGPAAAATSSAANHRRDVTSVAAQPHSAAAPSTYAQAVAVFAATAPSLIAKERSGPADDQVRKVGALTGYLAYGLIVLTVIYGVAISTGWARRGVRRSTLYGGHMTLAILALTFGAVHALAYVFQTTTHFSYLNALVPFVSGGELEVAFGIIGLELMAAAAFSIWVQRRLTYRRWHWFHRWASIVGSALGVIHTYATSPESRAPGLIGIVVTAGALVMAALYVLRALPATTLVRARLAPVEP